MRTWNNLRLSLIIAHGLMMFSLSVSAQGNSHCTRDCSDPCIHVSCSSGYECVATPCNAKQIRCGGCNEVPNPTATPRPTTPPPPVNTPAPGNNQCQYNACVGNRCETQTVGLCNGGGCGCYSNQCSDGDHGACGGGNTPTPTPTPLPVCTIQGLKYVYPGKLAVEPAISQTTITLDAAYAVDARPFSFQNISPGIHTVLSSRPGVNWDILSTQCENAVDTCHNSSPFKIGDTLSVNCPPNGYVDLWWYYLEYKGWYKLNKASFHAQDWVRNYIPNPAVEYDASDINQTYLVVDNTDPSNAQGVGVITSQKTIDIGIHTSRVSARDWTRGSYDIGPRGYLDNLTGFISYARAKKDVSVITDINNAESDRINIIEGDVYIDSNTFITGKKNIVLMATGDVTIANIPGNIFNTPVNRVSIAIISPKRIIFGPNVTDASGIFIANEVDLAGGVPSSNIPLKITGNMISSKPITNLKRRRPDGEFRQPSFYLEFNPTMYIDLLPYLSTIDISGRTMEGR